LLRGPARASAQPDLPFQRIPKAAEAADEADYPDITVKVLGIAQN